MIIVLTDAYLHAFPRVNLLHVTVPGVRKVEIECETSATFGDVKAKLQVLQWKAPPFFLA